ncbi:MAG: DeoR/GlpR family DNA-binding transcription regulator [Planctomycetia bacterium]|nr:DeoR/GlpR family DNA-binding transcription regulator [Planctomycetia bacterium]
MAPVVADERRGQLLELVRVRGFASLPELAGQLAVSESTVRRDLEYLEDQGVARRTHGGVFYTGQSPEFPHFKDRQVAYEVAQLLAGRPLQVVTNSMPVANLFASRTDSDLVLIGGNVLKRSGITIGPYANAMLRDINVRRAVISVAAVNDRGFFNSNILQVETQRAMIAAADEVLVVADSTKFGHSSLAHLCPLAEIDRLIVDNEISEDWRSRIVAAGVALTIAGGTDNG